MRFLGDGEQTKTEHYSGRHAEDIRIKFGLKHSPIAAGAFGNFTENFW